MTEHNRTNGPPPAAPDDRIRLLDYAAVLLTEWKTVLLVLVATVLVAAAIQWARPDTYVSTSTLVTVSESDGRAQMLGASLPPGLAARLGGSGDGNQKMVSAILKSQVLRDTLAARVAESRDEEAQIRFILAKRTQVKQNPAEGSIVVDVAAPDPGLAARIAGAYPALINEIATRLSVSAARRKEEVVQGQLADAHERLVRSEEALLAFHRSLGAADIPEQARQTLSAAAEFERAIIQQELEVARLRRTVTPDNPRLGAAVADLQSLREQRRRVTSGGTGNDLFLAQGDLAEIRTEAARLMRTFTRDEQVYVALSASLAATQVEVKDNTGLVTVLDPPTLPTAPVGAPLRMLVFSVVLGLVLGVIAAFVREYVRRISRDPDSHTFMLALEDFRSDMGRMLPHRRRTGAGSKL